MTDQRTPSASARVAVIADHVPPEDGGPKIAAELRGRHLIGYELDVVPAIGARRYDLVHILTPGPAGAAALSVAQELALPVLAAFDPDRHDGPLRFDRCDLVLSPSRSADAALTALGVAPVRMMRWAPGVDLERFHPARYAPESLPSGFNVLYVGPLHRDHGVELLADAFLTAHDRDPRIRLVLAGTGSERDPLRRRLGSAAAFLDSLEPDELPTIYATADLLVAPSTHNSAAHVILEAQASGLPVVAVESGIAAELIESGRSGCLVVPEPEILASAIRGLARRETLCDRLSTGGLMAVRDRSIERALARLGEAYTRAIATARFPAEVARAA